MSLGQGEGPLELNSLRHVIIAENIAFFLLSCHSKRIVNYRPDFRASLPQGFAIHIEICLISHHDLEH